MVTVGPQAIRHQGMRDDPVGPGVYEDGNNQRKQYAGVPTFALEGVAWIALGAGAQPQSCPCVWRSRAPTRRPSRDHSSVLAHWAAL